MSARERAGVEARARARERLSKAEAAPAPAPASEPSDASDALNVIQAGIVTSTSRPI